MNILNKHWRRADKRSSRLGVGEVLTLPHRENLTMLRNGYMSVGFELSLWYNLKKN